MVLARGHSVEQGVGVHGKEEGEDLVVGEAVQPRLVVSIRWADVNLWRVQRKSAVLLKVTKCSSEKLVLL